MSTKCYAPPACAARVVYAPVVKPYCPCATA